MTNFPQVISWRIHIQTCTPSFHTRINKKKITGVFVLDSDHLCQRTKTPSIFSCHNQINGLSSNSVCQSRDKFKHVKAGYRYKQTQIAKAKTIFENNWKITFIFLMDKKIRETNPG